MARKLKVYRTPTGFHDAYVAAPSQKAALEAWGSDADLFARSVAEVVTDEALTKEPLDNPGKVIRRPRGTADDYMAALPKAKHTPKRRVPPPEDDGPSARKPRTKPKKASATPAATPKPAAKAIPKRKRKPKPRPSRAKLDTAEQAIERANADHEAALVDIKRREQDLRDERRRLEDRHEATIAKLDTSLEKVRSAYQAAIEKWAAEDR